MLTKCFLEWINTTRKSKEDKEEEKKMRRGRFMCIHKIIVSKFCKYNAESCCAKCEMMLITPSLVLFLVFSSAKQLSKTRTASWLWGMKCGAKPSQAQWSNYTEHLTNTRAFLTLTERIVSKFKEGKEWVQREWEQKTKEALISP